LESIRQKSKYPEIRGTKAHISDLDFAVISLVAAVKVMAGTGIGRLKRLPVSGRGTSGSGHRRHERIARSIAQGAVVAVLAL
jgi:hypothetical protein